MVLHWLKAWVCLKFDAEHMENDAYDQGYMQGDMNGGMDGGGMDGGGMDGGGMDGGGDF